MTVSRLDGFLFLFLVTNDKEAVNLLGRVQVEVLVVSSRQVARMPGGFLKCFIVDYCHVV